jgi:hypothetical protein
MVEILAALAILVLGLSGIIGLVYGGVRQGQIVRDQNAVAILLPEAIQHIQRDHLITDSSDPNAGRYVQTLMNASESDKQSPYDDPLRPPDYLTGSNLNEWRRGEPMQIDGVYYRVRYRLEKHPEWQPHDADGHDAGPEDALSPFRGVYVLTVVCYQDPWQDGQRLVQISEPVAVYLRERREP